ncbi:MAG: hypothetical protein ACK5AZ_20630 [Bryobacteraceae bacterium]
MPGPLRELLDPGNWLAVKPRLDPEAPEIKLIHAPEAGEVKLRLWLGTIVLSIVTLLVLFILEDEFAIFVACGFGFFGLVNLGYGVLQSRFSLSLAITPAEVYFDSRTLFGARRWREPIANYRGVLLREEQMRSQNVGNMATTRRWFIIELTHADPAKRVALHVAEGGEPPRQLQEAFARRFGLPALSPDSGEIVESGAGLQTADPGAPPSGISVQEFDGVTRIVIGQSRLSKRLTWMWWLALPVLFGGLAYQIEPMAGLSAGAMAAVFVLMILGLGRLTNRGKGSTERAICLDRERIWIQGSVQTPPLARSEIERVRVDSYASFTGASQGTPIYHARLMIEGGSRRLEYIGTQFDGKRLEWVRNYLSDRLARQV